MAREKMIELVSKNICVSRNAAREALEAQLQEARDPARISYAASQKLGMISANGVDAVPIEAPDTRPNQTAAAQTEDSPHSVLGRTMTGSR